MSERIVSTQQELDRAIADGVGWIEIRSEAGVWLEIGNTDSATVTAYGSATVTASGSATVTAYGSATVTAYGSATVRASDSATVTASSHVAVHLHSGYVNLSGGVLIDHTSVDQEDAATWCEYHGVTVEDGVATLYKAVNDQWTTDRGTDYSPGSLPSCEDFRADNACGHGLHFSPTPVQAQHYHPEATKFLAIGVRVDELSTILDGVAKAKAPRVVVACREVDIDGNPMTAVRGER